MAAGQIELRVEWTVLPQQINDIGAAVHLLLTQSRGARGCLTSAMGTELGEVATIRLVQAWDTEEHLQAYVRSSRFESLAGIMESALQPPRVEFVLPTGVQGIEYAHDVRGEPGWPT